MRVAIDADLVGKNRSGNETYLRGIIGGLGELLSGTGHSLIITGSVREDIASITAAGVVAETLIIPKGIVGDLVLGRLLNSARASSVLATYNAPLAFTGTIATIVHDVSYRRMPDTFPWLLRNRIDLSVRRSIRVSDSIVTISEFSKQELLEVYPKLVSDRIVVAGCAANTRFYRRNITAEEMARVKEKYCLPDAFVLAVGNLQPRKNLGRLVTALQSVDVELIVVGQAGWLSEGVRTKLKGRVTSLGYVPDGDLPALYALASVFAYPSLYEGFGLPVIEAMAAGTPVITGRIGATAEVAGHGAILVDPYSLDEIRAGVEKLLGDDEVAAALIAKGYEQVERFSWVESARKLLPSLTGA